MYLLVKRSDYYSETLALYQEILWSLTPWASVLIGHKNKGFAELAFRVIPILAEADSATDYNQNGHCASC